MKHISGLISRFIIAHNWVRYVALLIFLILADGVIWSMLATPGLAGGGLDAILSEVFGPATHGMVNLNMTTQTEIDPIPILIELAVAVALCGVFVATGHQAWTRILLGFYTAYVTLTLVVTTFFMVMSLWNPIGLAIQFIIDVAIIWVFNIIIFAAWYWIIDSDRQAAAMAGDSLRLHFGFPQSGTRVGPWSGWKPSFLDYLFLSFTISTALSPTDTPCLTHRAKVLLMVQALISLLLILTIAARAINII